MLKHQIIKIQFLFYVLLSPYASFSQINETIPLSCHQTSLPFDSLLNDIDSQVKGDWDPPVKLYSTRNFAYVYENSSKYYLDIKRVLASPLNSDNKKMICVYLSQRFDFEKYLEFSNYCLQLFNRGLLTEDILYNVIVPYEWKTHMRFAEKYRDKAVSHFLKSVVNSERISALRRKAIIEIAKGKTFRFWQKMQRDIMEP